MDELIKDFNLDELGKELSDIIEDEEQQERFVIVREGIVKLTGGFMEAAILSSMISWQRTVNRMDKKVFDQIKDALENGDRVRAEKLKKKLHFGWFYKPAKEMREEMFNATSERTINRIFAKLEDMKFIEGKQLPNFDRKKYYKVNIAYIREKLTELGYNLDGYKLSKVKPTQKPQTLGNMPKRQNDGCKRQDDDSIRQNDGCKRQNDGAITLNYSLPTSLHNSLTGMYVGSEPRNPIQTFSSAYKLTKYAKQNLKEFTEKYGVLLVDEAVKRTIEAESDHPIAYTKKILENWAKKDVQTLDDINQYEEGHRRQQQQKKAKKSSGRPSGSDLPEALRSQSTAPEQEQDYSEQEAKIRERLKEMNRRFAETNPIFSRG